jgi:hypothetical protein
MKPAMQRGIAHPALLGQFVWAIVAVWSVLLLLLLTVASAGLTRMSPEFRAGLVELGIPIGAWRMVVIATSLLPAVGLYGAAALIIWRRPAERTALLSALVLTLLGGQPGNWRLFAPGAPLAWLAVPEVVTFIILSALGLFLFFTFPDGRFVPPRLRPPFLIWCVWMAASLIQPAALETFESRPPLWFPAGLAVGVAAQVYRYRRGSDATQRQQTKWVLLGMMALVVGYLTEASLAILLPREGLSPRDRVLYGTFGVAVGIVATLAVPITAAMALLRRRLWDVDALASRVLSYSLVTALLVGAYLGGVILLQRIFVLTVGQTSDLAIVASTLAIAAAFRPLRGRIQRAIDLRFNRRKYDAAHVLATFAATVRDEVELGRLTDQLRDVVQEAMQPASLSVWLREPQRSGERGWTRTSEERPPKR